MGKMIFATLLVLISIGMSMSYLSGATLRNFLQMQNAYIAQGALNSLKQQMVFDSGFYMAPLGVQGESYHELPSSLAGLRLAGKGTPFLYCPYGQPLSLAPNAEVTDASGVDYSVLKESLSGRDYVRQSATPPVAGILAAVVLPKSGEPSCADISVSADGRWILSGDSEGTGIVYVIHQDEMAYQGNQGLWLTAETSAGLADALLKAATAPAQKIVITLKPGVTFTVDGSYDFEGIPDDASVIIKSASSTAAHIQSTAVLSLKLSRAKLILENLTLSPSVFIESQNGGVDVINTQAGAVAVYNGSLNSVSSSFSSAGIPAIQLASATWHVAGSASVASDATPSVSLIDSFVFASLADINLNQGTAPQAIKMAGSVWKMHAGNLSFSPVSPGGMAVHIDGSSSFEMADATVEVQGTPDAAFYVDGALHMKNSLLSSAGNVAIYAGKTASVTLNSAQVGIDVARPQVGLWSDGGRFGGAVNVYALQCKSGDGFSLSVAVDFDDDTVSFANPDGSVVPASSNKSISVPLFEKINQVQINCL